MPKKSLEADGSFGTLGLQASRKPSQMPAKSLHPDHVEFFSALGRRIKELRRERGWSLHDMVVKHGYYQSQWQKYERGGPVTVDSLLRMASIFGIGLAALIDSLGQFPCTRIEEIKHEKISPTKAVKKPASRENASSRRECLATSSEQNV